MRVISEFYIPTVIEDSQKGRDWKYSGWRVLVTENPHNQFLARYLINLVRS
jgi:hypothetical protein